MLGYLKIAFSNFVRDDSDELKSLLELMMKVSPQNATKILKVAKHLANVMHEISSAENTGKDNAQCQGVEYLVHLGEILAKSVPGCENVDTTNSEWNELVSIPTDKEILESGKLVLHVHSVLTFLLPPGFFSPFFNSKSVCFLLTAHDFFSIMQLY